MEYLFAVAPQVPRDIVWMDDVFAVCMWIITTSRIPIHISICHREKDNCRAAHIIHIYFTKLIAWPLGWLGALSDRMYVPWMAHGRAGLFTLSWLGSRYTGSINERESVVVKWVGLDARMLCWHRFWMIKWSNSTWFDCVFQPNVFKCITGLY